MAIQYDSNQMPWLEPKHINLREVANDFVLLGADATIKKHALSSTEWDEAVQEIASVYRKGATSHGDVKNATVNTALASQALCFPPYGTVAELQEVERLLNLSTPDIASIKKIVFSIVMHPRFRALQLVGRFMKVAPFDEFAYLIDAATLSLYRGNIPSAFMTIVPVIEGILLRWQGYPGTLTKKPSFNETLAFIHDSPNRQPMPLLPLFFDSWIVVAEKILKDHLYRNTVAGPSVDNFNRHLALHLLDDQAFGTQENVTRAFLLVDVLSEIFICENRIEDPRWNTTDKEESPHFEAYVATLISQASANSPERILSKTHSKCK